MNLINVFCADIKESGYLAGGKFDYKISNLIVIWLVPLSLNHHRQGELFAYLDEAEQKRAKNYKRDFDARRYTLTRAALKLLLAKYSGQQPNAINLQYAQNRKPFLEVGSGKNIYFNVTHSGDLALIAINDQETGIDLEQIQPQFDYLEVLDNYFTGPEIEQIKNSPSPINTFYTFWTRKEALLKATGKGIIDELFEIEVLTGSNKLNGDLIGTKDNWTINSFPTGDGYVASLAAQHDQFKLMDLNFDELMAQL